MTLCCVKGVRTYEIELLILLKLLVFEIYIFNLIAFGVM